MSSSLLSQPLAVANQQTNSKSKGSYGPVFAVLSVIIVVAVISCAISRLCARKLGKEKATTSTRAHAVHDVESPEVNHAVEPKPDKPA